VPGGRLRPAIHDFAAHIKESRGWSACADHDELGTVRTSTDAVTPRRALTANSGRIRVRTDTVRTIVPNGWDPKATRSDCNRSCGVVPDRLVPLSVGRETHHAPFAR